MKTAIAIFLVFCSCASAQENKIIKVYSTKAGRDTSHQLIYPDLSSYMKLKSLAPGKQKFYIKANDSCRTMLYADKSPKLTDIETKDFNQYISAYKLEYYENDVLVSDCKKYSSLFFPIKITLLE